MSNRKLTAFVGFFEGEEDVGLSEGGRVVIGSVVRGVAVGPLVDKKNRA